MNLLLSATRLLVPVVLFANGLSQAPSDEPTTGIIQALRSRNYQVAIQRADVALKNRPDDPRLWALKALALNAEHPDDPSTALPSLRQALKVAPTYLPALEAAAQAEYTLGDPAARTHLEGVLSLRPEEPTANAMLAVLDFRASDFAAAATHFRMAGPLIGNQPEALAQYAASLANSGQLGDAIPIFARLVQLKPESGTAVYNLALAEYRQRRSQEALAHLAPLLASSAANEETLTLAAEINESLGQTQAAVDLLRKAILLHPKDPEAYLYLAHLSFAHSSVQVGIDILDAGIRQLPRESRFYAARGVLLSQLGKNDLAGSDFDKASALDPKLSMTQTARGIAQSQQHRDEQALATFREGVRAHPDDALAQYLLAEALSNNNPSPDSAEGREELSAVLRAVQLDPQMKAAQDLIATIYLRQNSFAEAAEHSEAALKIDPNDQQAIYHLVLTARKGINKEQLPALVKRLAAAKEAVPDPMESPHGFLVEAK